MTWNPDWLFLLNNTKKEAIYIPDDTEGQPYISVMRLTANLGPYQHLIKDWSFTDDIFLYSEDDWISLNTLKNYRALNFEVVDEHNVRIHCN